MSATILVILSGVAVTALAWLLLRFGKTLARWALVFGVLAAVIILGLALLENARATRRAVTVATVASAGAAGVSGLAVILSGMLLAAVGVIGYLALRLRAAEGWTLLSRRKRRKRRLPRSGSGLYGTLPSSEESIWASPYTVEESDGLDLVDLDLSDWGW
jgi:hypothetical protein